MKRIVRENYRLNKDRFPDTGALLYVVKIIGDDDLIRKEMFVLAERILEHPDY